MYCPHPSYQKSKSDGIPSSNQLQALTGISSTSKMYEYNGTCRLLSDVLIVAENCVLEWWVQLMHRAHLNEQQHTLIFVLWPSLINAYHVVDACSKRTTLEHAINIAQTKAHARRVQHAVAAIPSAHSSNGRDVGTCTPAAEDYVSLCAWVHRDEVAVAPYARVGVMRYDLVDETVASRISRAYRRTTCLPR